MEILKSIDGKATQQAIEKVLRQYRTYQLTTPEELLPTITPKYTLEMPSFGGTVNSKMKKLQRLLNDFCATMQPNGFLFKSRQGKIKPITRIRAYDILREAAHHCELKEIGTHTLRKTFSFLVYQNEKVVALLQDIFNHSAPYITLKYIGVNQAAIEDAYNALKNLRI